MHNFIFTSTMSRVHTKWYLTVASVCKWDGDSSVDIMTRLRAESSRVRILAGEGDFSQLKNVQIGSGAHPAPNSMGHRGYFSDKGAGA
jgi:hypothetical protein